MKEFNPDGLDFDQAREVHFQRFLNKFWLPDMISSAREADNFRSVLLTTVKCSCLIASGSEIQDVVQRAGSRALASTLLVVQLDRIGSLLNIREFLHNDLIVLRDARVMDILTPIEGKWLSFEVASFPALNFHEKIPEVDARSLKEIQNWCSLGDMKPTVSDILGDGL